MLLDIRDRALWLGEGGEEKATQGETAARSGRVPTAPDAPAAPEVPLPDRDRGPARVAVGTRRGRGKAPFLFPPRDRAGN